VEVEKGPRPVGSRAKSMFEWCHKYFVGLIFYCPPPSPEGLPTALGGGDFGRTTSPLIPILTLCRCSIDFSVAATTCAGTARMQFFGLFFETNGEPNTHSAYVISNRVIFTYGIVVWHRRYPPPSRRR